MKMHIIAAMATVGLGALVSAQPVEFAPRGDTCTADPWFLVPHLSHDCHGPGRPYQPNSGPISSSPQNVYCQSLWGDNEKRHSYASVAVNLDACPTQKWKINLYTADDCSCAPVVVTSDSCVKAPHPDDWKTGRFVKFDAVLVS